MANPFGARFVQPPVHPPAPTAYWPSGATFRGPGFHRVRDPSAMHGTLMSRPDDVFAAWEAVVPGACQCSHLNSIESGRRKGSIGNCGCRLNLGPNGVRMSSPGSAPAGPGLQFAHVQGAEGAPLGGVATSRTKRLVPNPGRHRFTPRPLSGPEVQAAVIPRASRSRPCANLRDPLRGRPDDVFAAGHASSKGDGATWGPSRARVPRSIPFSSSGSPAHVD